jgi:homopolymeric O-antigen transport system permease protein
MNQKRVVVIQPGRVAGQYWHDLWRFRELFYSLAWRDIAVRYKQTLIGITWSLLKPLATMTVFTIVFGAIAKLPSGGAPYAVFVLAALLPWQFFSSALQESSNSLIGNSGMITKIYFPRLIIPVSAVIVSLIDLLIAFAVLLVFLWWYGMVPEWKLLALPAFALLAFGLAVGAGLWFSALNVQYRDFRFIVPFVVQLGVFVSPVGFGSAVVPQRWKLLYSLNPLVGIIDGFRWSIIPGQPIDWRTVATSVTLTVMLLLSGVWFFRKTERYFADVI